MKKYQKLKESKEYRNAFVESQINIGIPFQVRALRKQRKWDQKTLAQQAGMAQPRISAIERPGHGTLNLRTLLSLASAFNVGLMVRFVPFSELYRWEDSFSPDTFEVPSINEEPRLLAQIDNGNQANALAQAIEIDRLREINAELVATLGDYVEQTTRYINGYATALPDATRARTALAKAAPLSNEPFGISK